jgi:hypothetical protein
MEADRYARYGAASGIVAAILTVVGFFIFGTDIPNADASAQEWGSFFKDNQTQVQVGATIVGAGLFFFLWFLGSLRSAIAAAEGGAARLASIAFGGGIIVVAFFMLAITGGVTAAFRPEQVDPNLTRALNDFGALAGAPASAGFAALFAASAIAGYRHGAVPAPVAGLSALAAVTAPLAFGIVFTDSGVFAPDGVLGLWVPFVTAVVALVALSVALVRAAGPQTAAPAPAPPPATPAA